MSNTEVDTHAQDGDHVTRNENDTKDQKETKTVSFDKDVQVKRFGKPRESRSSSSEYKPPIRKEPFTHLSKEELIEEANKVRAQTESVTCTADHPPEKFYSLPHRRKLKQEEKEKVERRNSQEDTQPKKPLGRSTSDVNPKKRKERTSLSTLFRKAQKSKSPETVKVSTKPVVKVKRSKSDVSDLKSKPNVNIQPKPIRKRSGSETEEFLKSLRNKKSQLSPIIENSPRDDYFRKTPPLEAFQKKKLQEAAKTEVKAPERKVNPIEKPPRYKSPEKEPKPPVRTKRGKSEEKLEVKIPLLVDEVDSVRGKDINPVEIKERIKESIRKIEENIYGTKDMIHSSQQPPDKPPLTRGNNEHILRILKEDQYTPPPKAHLLSQNSTNVNQPFSYTKPSVSPDPNLFTRTTSPDRVPSPVNKMDKGVVYAHVVRDNVEDGTSKFKKQTVHKTYSPSRDRYGNGNHSDEDEGLGYDERQKASLTKKYEYDYKKRNEENQNSFKGLKINDSPIRPRFREYKLTSFDDFEPTYANEYSRTSPKEGRDFVDSAIRGRADGMDTMRKQFEDKADLNFNELSHRRQLLESRLNARRFTERQADEPVTRLLEKDPIYEAEKRMKATEKYVNETARYYRHTTERDGFSESNVAEDYNRYGSDNNNVKYSTESRTFDKIPKGEIDRREFIDHLPRDIERFKDESLSFPPEPEYEPPSLELQKPVLSPNEYTEKKYKVKSKQVTSSHDVIQTSKYKKDDFGTRKGHYASNPEINQDRDEDYVNSRESYHNSLRREKHKDKYHNEIRRHDSADSYGYRDDRSPRRFDVDNRLVDSGIENDFRKDSGELHRYRRPESDDEVRDSSTFLANERRHTEDTYPSEQIYANGEYITRFEKPGSRERSADDGALFDRNRYDKSPSREDKVSAKPPKAKKLSGLEKVKQLFSRDSSKKSKKEKVTEKNRTRVLKSPEHLGDEYTRYRDPDPDDRRYREPDTDDRRYRDPDTSDENRYREEPSDDERRYRGSKDHLDRSPDPRDSDTEKYKYEEQYVKDLAKENKYRVKERSYRTEKRREERRWYASSDRDSDHQARPSDVESDLRPSRKTRSKTADPLDSPALAERNRDRRRLATPSPTPSPPRRSTPASPPQNSAGNWFKSLDRLTRKRTKNTKVEKETSTNTEDESPKSWSKPNKATNSPAKNLRFFGDTDVESDNKHSTLTKTKSYPNHSALRKTISNSSQEDPKDPRKTGSMTSLHREVRKTVSGSSQDEYRRRTGSGSRQDEDRKKSGSMNSLHGDRKYYRRNLHNISEIHSASETESTPGRRMHQKPPLPQDRRSRSQSSSKTQDVRDRGSSELRGSRQDLKHRRRTPGNHSGESSTEGESSHPSQRSVVYLHATTVGDIPDPARARHRSRDDVSSVNSSNLQIKTTQKSFSIFAPWTPRLYSDQHDVHYAQKPRKLQDSKSPSTRNLSERPGTLQKKKSYSQTTLSRKPQNNRLTNSSTTLNRDRERRRDDSVVSGTISRNKKTQSNEVLNSRDKVSRSISMPKDKKAGWFNLTNKNKKQEINTRVR